MPNAPYRTGAPVEFDFAWRTHEEADEALPELIERLRAHGVVLEPTAALLLTPYARALAESEGEVGVLVAWTFVKQLNGLLVEAGSEERLYRTRETSTRWVLATPSAAAERRTDDEPMLERKPPIPVDWLGLSSVLAALVAGAALVVALLNADAAGTLAAWAVASAVSHLIGRRIAPDAPRSRRNLHALLQLAVLCIPVGGLLHGGQLGALAVVVPAVAYQLWASARLRASRRRS